jgi:hypothetical protein
VLVACEYSGIVRDAFLRAGHDAISCDLLPSESDFGPHIRGDVLPLLRQPWDLVIAHPPCTYLTLSGVRWLYDDRYPLRWQNLIDGAAFFRACLEANAPRVAVENPTMHGWAAKIVGSKATQTVQPYQFGHLETKGVGLWLKGLPPLVATEDVQAAMMQLPINERAKTHWAGNTKDRSKIRSRFFEGIAAAMATQWGDDASEAAA